HVVNVARLLRGRCRLHKESVMSDLAPVPGLRPVRLDDKTKSIMDRAIAREQSLSRLLMTFIVTGLIFVLLPGTFLGVWNLIKISSRQAVNSVSPAWIQAHGHAQLFGWVGTFILGIGFYSIPKLRKLKPFALWSAWLTWALWLSGVTVRWSSNIYPWHWRIALPLSGTLVLAAFLIFATGPGFEHRGCDPGLPRTLLRGQHTSFGWSGNGCCGDSFLRARGETGENRQRAPKFSGIHPNRVWLVAHRRRSQRLGRAC